MAFNEYSSRRLLADANADKFSRFSDDVNIVLNMSRGLLQCLLMLFMFYLVTKIMDRFLQPKDGDDEEAAALRAIQVVVYDKSPVTRSTAATEEADCCPICLEEYEGGEELRVMPRCKHEFHRECIDRWLTSRSSLCPICRDRVIERC